MIPVFAALADGGSIVTLDDPAVVTDLADADGTNGTAYSPYLRSHDLVAANVTGFSRFRRVNQRVHRAGTATLTFTPWRDGQETNQTITRTLALTDNPAVRAPFATTGAAFQVQIAVTAFTGVVSLGAAEALIVPRRSER